MSDLIPDRKTSIRFLLPHPMGAVLAGISNFLNYPPQYWTYKIDDRPGVSVIALQDDWGDLGEISVWERPQNQCFITTTPPPAISLKKLLDLLSDRKLTLTEEELPILAPVIRAVYGRKVFDIDEREFGDLDKGGSGLPNDETPVITKAESEAAHPILMNLRDWADNRKLQDHRELVGAILVELRLNEVRVDEIDAVNSIANLPDIKNGIDLQTIFDAYGVIDWERKMIAMSQEGHVAQEIALRYKKSVGHVYNRLSYWRNILGENIVPRRRED